MSHVDFYLLASTSTQQRWLVACKLAEKAYLQDLKVVLFSDNDANAEALDELLWTFTERAFVPHEISRSRVVVDPEVAVRLTTDLSRVGGADLLVNISDRLPQDCVRFSRIAEILDAEEQCRRLGRERYKAYRDQKLTLDTHQLSDAAAL